MTDTTRVPDVPVDAQDPRRKFEFLVPKVEDEADLLQFHAVDAMMRDLRDRRLRENAALLDMEKLWEQRKSELRDSLLRLAAEAKVQTILATTYTQARQDSITWTDDNAVAVWMNANDLPLYREDVEATVKLSAEGRERVRRLLLDRARRGLDVPPGVTVTPAGRSVVTRHRSGPVLSAQTVLAQRGRNLDLLTHDDQPEPTETDNDQPEPTDS